MIPKLDFCPDCRLMIDAALDRVGSKLFIQVTPMIEIPAGLYPVPLCRECQALVRHYDDVDGFTITTKEEIWNQKSMDS